MKGIFAAGFVFLFTVLGGRAEDVSFKIPDWNDVAWANLPPGETELEPRDYRGRVLVLFFFQNFCSGCQRSHGPVIADLYKRYEEDPRVAFVAIQTAFEVGEKNTMELGTAFINGKLKMDIPVGLNGTGNHDAELMSVYRTGGTPCTFVVGPMGKARYKKFGDVRWDRPETMKAFNDELEEVIGKYIGRAKAPAVEEEAVEVVEPTKRKLRNREGHEIDAELLSLDGGVLSVRSRGRKFNIPVEKLSDEDQEFLMTWKPEKE